MKTIFRALTRIAVVGALFFATFGSATAAHAQSAWYWWESNNNQDCWSTTAGPSAPWSPQCVTPGANYFPTSNGRTTYIGRGFYGGAFADVDGHASQSGDYCNSYPQTFSTYLDAPSDYYWGESSSQSYCYAKGALWGTNVKNNVTDNSNPGKDYPAPGAQHFASLQSIGAYPWSSQFGGANAQLYVRTQFGVSTNSTTQAWGYVCADLVDTAGQGNTLEVCGDKWDWGKKVPDAHDMACMNLSGEKPIALPVNKYGTDHTYMTTQPGSASTATSKTLTRGTLFTMAITSTNLLNAIRDANSSTIGCTKNHQYWSTNLSGYRLMGVEDGLELSDATPNHQVNGAEQGLVVADLY
ncbi:MAG: hypothetical protein ACRDV3_16250 [Acidothermaceae bacterium]